MFHLSVLLLLKLLKLFNRPTVILSAICMQFGSLAMSEENSYVPYSGIIKGTHGINSLQLIIINTTNFPITCISQLAHWYSATLGTVKKDQAIQQVLWHDPKTGVINLMNNTDDRMPIEAIWCGLDFNISVTRTKIELPISIGVLPTQILYNCSKQTKGRLKCKEITK